MRVFHWSLVGGVAITWGTGGSGSAIHEIAGSAVAGLILFRLVWGVVGSTHARFADFVKPPAVILADVRGLMRGRPQRTLGHNPSGGVMIVILLALLVVLSTSGWAMLTTWGFGLAWLERVHGLAAEALIVAIGVHVAGVVGSSILRRENLVRAMVTGVKTTPIATRETPGPARRLDQRRERLGLALLAALSLIGMAYGYAITAGRSEVQAPPDALVDTPDRPS